MDEMARAEGLLTLQEKYVTRMTAKTDQINRILPHLGFFKNQKFKFQVAELIQWCLLQLDPPKLYTQTFSVTLKLNLEEMKRFDGDMKEIAADINRKFKFVSPTTQLPES